ncbi:hypothetical protein ACFWFH_12925 [Streptomyces coelicoflavus]|uniref:hypothetical protein n=1 Tax=Streptomyces coelicoflavus TaxID=285562 RepID=UPI00344CC78A
MLDADLLKHPVIRDCIDALVDGGGGLVVYGQGLGGRETLVASAVGIAAASGETLTIVDAELLREPTARLATQLGLAELNFLSPAQAASWPTGFDRDGVLAIHGDVLRNQDLVEPLRAAARDASLHGHLVVARHPYGSDSLDACTTQFREIAAADFMPEYAAADSDSPDTPGLIARRVQSPSWQAQQIHEPEWIPRDTDRQAETLAQEWGAQWAAAGEPLTPTATPAESGDPSEEALDRVRSRWRQLRRTQPEAPESGPGSAEPDSGPVFWVTRDSTTGRPDIGADLLETKRQFLADFRGEDSERRRRAMELVFPQHPADAAEEERISYEELRTALEDPGTLQALQSKADEIQAATEQRLTQAAEAIARTAAAARAPHASRPSGHTAEHPSIQQPPPSAAPPQQGPRP